MSDVLEESKSEVGAEDMRTNKRTLFGAVSLLSFMCFSFFAPCGFAATEEMGSNLTTPQPTPLPSPSPNPTQSENTPPRRDLRIPQHQFVRPTLGVALDFSYNAFGGTGIAQAQGTNRALGFSAAVEYQPAFIQNFGIIGVGPSLSIFPIGGDVTGTFASVISAGGQARYQLRYFRNQVLVPTIAYHMEYLYFDFQGNPMGGTWIQGPSVGLWFLLNVLEPATSNAAYISSGITRTYLIAQWKSMRGISDSGSVYVAGGSYYFGLRFEF